MLINKLSSIIITISVAAMFYSSAVNAQAVQWTKTYGGTGDDGGESMLLTVNNEIVITGFRSPGAYIYKDVFLTKTDAEGNEIWNRIYNINLNDWARSLKQTSDGGFIIAGMTEVSPQIHDPFLIKTDSDGNVQWTHQYDYGFGDDDRAHAVWQTSDGGYIIAGQTWLMHGPFGNYDMYIIKTDMNGNIQWKKVFFREESGGDVALGIQQLGDGGYIIGGFTQSSVWASYIIRTDNAGNAVWSNIYPGAWQSECYDIQTTPDGGFIYTGTESSFTTDTDVLLVKLDGNGVLQWKNIYGSVDADQGEYIQQLQDGGYIISGMSAAGGNGYNMYVVRTNAAGNLLWSGNIGGSGDDRAFSVTTTPDGTHLVTGWTWSYGQGLGDIYLVKLFDSVVPVELTSFTASVNEKDVRLSWTTATELNNSGFEVQKRNGFGEWFNIAFIKGSGTTQQSQNYSYTDQLLSAGSYSYRLKQVDYDGSSEYSEVLEVEVNSIPVRFSLEQNYPNPFNPTTTIRFSIPESGITTLKVYNTVGSEVATLLNEVKQPGTYEVNFDAADLSSGAYFYSIETDNFREVKKMILMK